MLSCCTCTSSSCCVLFIHPILSRPTTSLTNSSLLFSISVQLHPFISLSISLFHLPGTISPLCQRLTLDAHLFVLSIPTPLQSRVLPFSPAQSSRSQSTIGAVPVLHICRLSGIASYPSPLAAPTPTLPFHPSLSARVQSTTLPSRLQSFWQTATNHHHYSSSSILQVSLPVAALSLSSSTSSQPSVRLSYCPAVVHHSGSLDASSVPNNPMSCPRMRQPS